MLKVGRRTKVQEIYDAYERLVMLSERALPHRQWLYAGRYWEIAAMCRQHISRMCTVLDLDRETATVADVLARGTVSPSRTRIAHTLLRCITTDKLFCYDRMTGNIQYTREIKRWASATLREKGYQA